MHDRFGLGRLGIRRMKSLLDKDFRYVQANSTDLKETFKRVRERQEKEAKEKAEKVKPLIRGKVNGR